MPLKNGNAAAVSAAPWLGGLLLPSAPRPAACRAALRPRRDRLATGKALVLTRTALTLAPLPLGRPSLALVVRRPSDLREPVGAAAGGADVHGRVVAEQPLQVE